MTNIKNKIILGVDPGTNLLGYGIILVKGTQLELLSMGIIQLSQYEDHYRKLQKIYERLKILIEQYSPEEFAIEAPFYGKNVQSMLKLGRAQGIAIAAAMHYNIPVFEYAPKKIKQSITGNGNASKEQVAAILTQIIKMDASPKFLDATDGLATAICHHYQSSNPLNDLGKGGANWDAFIKNNPGRII